MFSSQISDILQKKKVNWTIDNFFIKKITILKKYIFS